MPDPLSPDTKLKHYFIPIMNSVYEIVRLNTSNDVYDIRGSKLISSDVLDLIYPMKLGILLTHFIVDKIHYARVFWDLEKDTYSLSEKERKIWNFEVNARMFYEQFHSKEHRGTNKHLRNQIFVTPVDNLMLVCPNAVKMKRILLNEEYPTYALIKDLSKINISNEKRSKYQSYDGKRFIDTSTDICFKHVGKVVECNPDLPYPVKVQFPNGMSDRFCIEDLMFCVNV